MMLGNRLREATKRHGGRGNLVRAWGARLRAITGGYRPFKRVHWGGVHRLVFVCKGNICRSPYAAGRARALGLEARSCGLEAQKGKPAEPTAAGVARERDVDLDVASATPVQAFPFEPGDLVLVMEPSQLRDALRAGAGEHETQVTLLGLWASPVVPVIPDPYGKNIASFHHCFSIIDSAITTLGVHIEAARVSRSLEAAGDAGIRS